MENKALKIHPKDNVAVALIDLLKGTNIEIDGDQFKLVTNVSAKHKFGLRDFNRGEQISMYGVTVGKATLPIKKGEVLTRKNVKHESSVAQKKTKSISWDKPIIDRWENRTFLGYHRSDGQVGTKNVWLFFPLVFCENKNIEILKDVFERELSLYDTTTSHHLYLRSLIQGKGKVDISTEPIIQKEPLFKNIEVQFITHQGGCGGIRQDSVALARLFSGYVNNPNVAGATILSLGCQNLQIDIFKKALKRINPSFEKPLLIYEQQQLGTIDTMINKVIKESFEAIKKADKIERKPAPLSKLKLGLECGGSDGFSGISANPSLGYASDLLAALGGSPILAEFPELCGVEQELMNRCVTDEIADRFIGYMRSYEEAAIASGSGFDMNPSPGNIKDGLITDAMKSAGAAKKGGTSPITDVLDYGDYVTEPGLNLLNTPGNDVESTTALVGAGANIVVFTTGLGTPTGNPVAPVIKLASNTKLARWMPDIIDLDAGGVITGEKTIQEMGEELLDLIVEVASGNITAKANQRKQNDFIPWKRGVSL